MNQKLKNLILSFHTLTTHLQPEFQLTDVSAIVRNTSYSKGTRCAAEFILHVANKDSFDFKLAWPHWDLSQRQAFMTWKEDPWYL